MKDDMILGRVSDLQTNEMREVDTGKTKLLLVRQGQQITAVGATCPHAGAPLAEGVLDNGTIICPWHKAAFCARTGRRIDPPAVDNIEVYPLKLEDGNIYIAGGVTEKPLIPAAEDTRHFIIMGAGAAGFSAAQGLREAGFGGALTLISHEEELPYDRTILSKYSLSGQKGDEKSPLQNNDYYAMQKITRRKAEIVKLDPEARRIILSDNQSLVYDAALIATGGIIMPPPFPGGDLANVFALRSQKDAEQIVRAADRSRRVVVIGASFIGMEAAAALRERGLDVTIVAGEHAPFEHQLGPVVGNVFRKIHEKKGVVFRLGVRVARLAGEQTVAAVILENGDRLEADLVVAGLGVRPATDFVKLLTRKDDQALVVDPYLRVSQALYAAGDVAAFPLYGNGSLVRVEHWRVAEQQGEIAARNMLGHNERFSAVPYFWTIQYMMRLDYVGHASGDDTLVVRGNLQERKFIAYYLRDGVVAAAAGMNQDQDMAAIIALMNRRQNWFVDELHPVDSTPYRTLKAADMVRTA